MDASAFKTILLKKNKICTVGTLIMQTPTVEPNDGIFNTWESGFGAVAAERAMKFFMNFTFPTVNAWE